METNKLIYTAAKTYIENGVMYEIRVTSRLDDECKNGVCHFSTTGNIRYKAKNGRWIYHSGGCLHEEVLKHFPELAPLIDLHLCEFNGEPLYPVENGMYFFRENGISDGARYLGVDNETAEKLMLPVIAGDKDYFKYLLFSLGVADMWKAKADKAIQLLQKLTGNVWKNPYDSPRVLSLDQSLKEDIESKIKSGYYSDEAITARAVQAENEKAAKQRQDIIDSFNKKTEKLQQERDIKLYLFDRFGYRVLDNCIYYDHSGVIAFNWRGYGDKLTNDEINGIKESFDFSKFPFVKDIVNSNK